jgi:hypothetical protein
MGRSFHRRWPVSTLRKRQRPNSSFRMRDSVRTKAIVRAARGVCGGAPVAAHGAEVHVVVYIAGGEEDVCDAVDEVGG